MTKLQSGLKITLIIEMIIGFLGACFLALFMATMATDSSASSSFHMFLGGIVGFLIGFVPAVVLPYFALKELKAYQQKENLTLNIINSVLVFILILLPLGLIQFFLIYKVGKEKNS